jgi:hypothetical protein
MTFSNRLQVFIGVGIVGKLATLNVDLSLYIIDVSVRDMDRRDTIRFVGLALDLREIVSDVNSVKNRSTINMSYVINPVSMVRRICTCNQAN